MKLDLSIHQTAAVMQQAVGIELMDEQRIAQQDKDESADLVVGGIVVGRHESHYDGRPFWYVMTSVRHGDSDKPAKLGQPKSGESPSPTMERRRARCHALAAAVLDGVGQWEDTLWLAEDDRVLHLTRPFHDDEIRALHGALPEMERGTDAIPAGQTPWKAPAAEYRRTISLVAAGEQPPEPKGK